jgi:hypothetical protein
MNNVMKKTIITTVVAGVMAGSMAMANSITFSGTDATLGHSASATFVLNGNQLTVTLANLGTVTSANESQSDVLTAVLFNLGGTATLTPTLETDSTILNGSALVPSSFNLSGASVGGNWAYQKPLSSSPSWVNGANAGISTTGLNVFDSGGQNGPAGVFGSPGANLDGSAFGIINTSDGFNGAKEPYIDNSLKFIIDVSGSFNLSQITDLEFAYGTQPDSVLSASVVPVPDAISTMAILGFALVGVEGLRRKLRA